MKTWLHISILIALLIITVVLAYPHLSDPLLTDETQFATTAKTIIERGFPHCYFYHTLKPYLSHPPTYSYLLSTVLPHLGDISGRYLGLALFLLTLIMAFVLLQRLYNNKYISLFILLIIILTPLTIPTATLLDMDGTILPLLFILTSFAIVARFRGEGPPLIIIALLVCALFLIKLTTPPALILALLVMLIFKEKRETTVKLLLSAFTGLLASLLILVIFYKLHNQPTFGPLSIMLLKTSTIPSLKTIFKDLIILTLWINPLLVMLLIWSGYKLLKGRHPLEERFLYITGLIITLGYTIINGIAYSLPKYQMVGFLMMIIPSAKLIYDKLQKLWTNEKFITLLTFTLSIIFALFAVKDYLHPILTAKERLVLGLNTNGEIVSEVITRTGLYILPVIIIGYLLLRRRKWALSVAAVMMMSLMLGQSIMMSSGDYSVRYNYGETGILMTTQLVEERLEGRVLICPKDIAYHNDFTHNFIDTTLYLRDEMDDDPILSGEPSLFITRASYLIHIPYYTRLEEIRPYLEEAKMRLVVGFFVVYELN